MRQVDALVLGAGMVGVSVAWHLQKRGMATLLLDRRGAMEETSFGNAGLIQREGVVPYGFPQDLVSLMRIAGNRAIDAVYHWAALPRIAGFLLRYRRNSRPHVHAQIARSYAPLIERCVEEHDAIALAADCSHLIRRGGWIRAFRSTEARDAALGEAESWRREFGVAYRALDAAALAAAEPHLAPVMCGALHWTEPATVPDPHALGLGYLAHFERMGGIFAQGDATTLCEAGGHWRVATAAGPVSAPRAVVALGPWADAVTRGLGYELPLMVKRGYHMHFGARGGASLNHPVLDSERGYCLVPTPRGVRLTTGAEFALRDAPPTPVQLARAEPLAREWFPLDKRLDAAPWKGARPCTPDMLPIIGPAPRHRGLWFAFGHAHHGLTLGPVTGRLIGEMIAGEDTCVDAQPFRADRF
ncbi:MAG: FAD-binding oxidoreductase [Burkholderiales bacterium]|nr:FAD-binding oxidoreductase [Burkholderiales bacterium]